MKDYCSKFKLPKGQRNNSNAIDNPAALATTILTPPSSSTDATQEANSTAEKEEDKNRSGPLVEIVNGEIVIQQSSIIVGGRQTTEEVDRQLNGHVVEEESAGITATYTSFRKHPKAQTWTMAETRRFYWALRQCGTDFSTMESFFKEEEDIGDDTIAE